MRGLLLIALAASISAAPCRAETVEQAAQRYFEFMRAGDVVAAAAQFDANEHRVFRESFSFLDDLPDETKTELYAAFFGADATPEAIANLSDESYFAAFFGFVMARSGMLQVMRTARVEYLGYVSEGEDVAHALTRISYAGPAGDVETLDVASFVRRGDEWKMKMTADIRSIADNIRSAMRRGQ